jgi:hypothetical protein
VEVPEPHVFERNEWVRVLLATVSGLLPRLATGCGKATVMDFDFATRTYSVKSLARDARGRPRLPSLRWSTHAGAAPRMCIAAAAQQRGGEGDQPALAIDRGVVHRAVLEGAMASQARGEEGRGRARQVYSLSPMDACLPPSLCFFHWPTHHRCNPAQP